MRPPEPFRAAFVLAALTGLRAIGPGLGDPATHAAELVFGFLSVQLLGFLLAALPRWLGQPRIPRPLGPVWALWPVLAGHALAFAWGFFDLEAAARLRAVVALAGLLLLAANVPPGKRLTVLPMLALAGLHAGLGAAFAFLHWRPALMAGFAAIVFICLEISDRVGAALVANSRERNGHALLGAAARPGWVLQLQRWSGGVALAAWAAALNPAAPALVAALAGAYGLWRMRVWEIRPYAGVVILVLGLAWKRLGFLLLALGGSGVVAVPPLAIVHAFAVGGLATLAIAIATSTIRKRDKRAFVPSRLARLVYLAISAAALARLGAEFMPAGRDGLLLAGQWSWAAAFLGYTAFALAGLRRGRIPAADV